MKELEDLVGKLVVKKKGLYGGLAGVLFKQVKNNEVIYLIDYSGLYCRVTHVSQIELHSTI